MILQKEISEGLIKEVNEVLKLENSRNTWKNKFESPEFKRAAGIGEKVGSPLNRSINCGCIDDLFVVLKLINRKYKSQKPNTMEKRNCKFRIKNDGMIQVHGIEPITNDNLTDEKAVELLQRNEKHISNFDIYPDNWKELIGGEVEKPKKAIKTEKVVVTEEEIDEVVTEEPTELTREQELLAVGAEEGGKDVLKQLCASLVEADKAPKKPHHNAGIEKLVEFILKYENA